MYCGHWALAWFYLGIQHLFRLLFDSILATVEYYYFNFYKLTILKLLSLCNIVSFDQLWLFEYSFIQVSHTVVHRALNLNYLSSLLCISSHSLLLLLLCIYIYINLNLALDKEQYVIFKSACRANKSPTQQNSYANSLCQKRNS